MNSTDPQGQNHGCEIILIADKLSCVSSCTSSLYRCHTDYRSALEIKLTKMRTLFYPWNMKHGELANVDLGAYCNETYIKHHSPANEDHFLWSKD